MEERSDREASHRLGFRQRESIGDYFYTISYIPDRAFETAKQAKANGHRYLVQQALSEGKPTGRWYILQVRVINPKDKKWAWVNAESKWGKQEAINVAKTKYSSRTTRIIGPMRGMPGGGFLEFFKGEEWVVWQSDKPDRKSKPFHSPKNRLIKPPKFRKPKPSKSNDRDLGMGIVETRTRHGRKRHLKLT
jgi:hypothetical protein